ncbi:MAG: hypothetical protein WA231_15890, partial [Methylocella sp.]
RSPVEFGRRGTIETSQLRRPGRQAGATPAQIAADRGTAVDVTQLISSVTVVQGRIAYGVVLLLAARDYTGWAVRVPLSAALAARSPGWWLARRTPSSCCS